MSTIPREARRQRTRVPSTRVPSETNTAAMSASTRVPLFSASNTAAISGTLIEVVDPLLCQQVTIHSHDFFSKVAGLLYTRSGTGILALGSTGGLRLWKWTSGKATASVTPEHWRPQNTRPLMANDVPSNPVGFPCVALTNKDVLVSACGGAISIFNMLTFECKNSWVPPIPVTSLAIFPASTSILAIGMEDSHILVVNFQNKEVLAELEGHEKHVTCLAFSTALAILVSSGADAQLFFWTSSVAAAVATGKKDATKAPAWTTLKSLAIQLPQGKEQEQEREFRVEFHKDDVQLLVSHKTQLAIYDASKMELVHKWVPHGGLSSEITFACYTGNSQRVYAALTDGNIAVFDAESLMLRVRIDPSVYMPVEIPPNSARIIPLVLTAHPDEEKQLAVGFSDGSIKVMELLQDF